MLKVIMKKEPFFSVIIPTYNRAVLLMSALKSVMEQTNSDWEVIVVDDGSTDNTREVVADLHDSRIHYIYQKNAERSAARNNGISHAQGKFICFLDSDDTFLPNHLKCLYDLILEKKEAVGMYVTNVMRNQFGKRLDVAFESVTDYKNAVCYFLTARESIISTRVAIHADILKRFQFDPNLKVSEDTDLWVRIAVHYPIYQTPEATVVYHIHDDNSTNTASNPFTNQLVALKKIFSDPVLKKMIPSSVRNQKLSRCYYGIATFHFYKKNYSQMMRNLVTSIVWSPSSPTTRAKLYMMGAGLAYALGLKR